MADEYYNPRAFRPVAWEVNNGIHVVTLNNGSVITSKDSCNWECITEGKPRLSVQELIDTLRLVVDTYEDGGWPTATMVIAKAVLEKWEQNEI